MAFELAQQLLDLFSAALRSVGFTSQRLSQQHRQDGDGDGGAEAQGERPASKRHSKSKSKSKRAKREQSSDPQPMEVEAEVSERDAKAEEEAAQVMLLQAVLAAETLAVTFTNLMHAPAHKSILLVQMDHVIVHLLRGSCPYCSLPFIH